MRKVFTPLLALTLISLSATGQTASWHDAAAEKAQRPAKELRQAPTAMRTTATKALTAGNVNLSETAFRQGSVTPRRLSAPAKAVTAADVPANPLQLTYNGVTFQYVNETDVAVRGDSIFLNNFFGWGTTVKAAIDLSTGDFTIKRQKVYQHQQYGQVDIMACDVKANVFDPNGTIPGKLTQGKVEIGPWVAIIIEGEMKNYAIGYGMHSNSDFVASNAQMTSKVVELDSAGHVTSTTDETVRLYVEQPGTNGIRIFNLSGTGSKIECFLHSDSTFSIAPQQLFSNSYGPFFCYPADWTQGVYWPSRDIKGTTGDKCLNFGNWAIFTNTGKYYYRRYQSTVLTVPFELQFPPKSEGWAGTGAAEDPYQIATVADLFALSEAVNSAEVPTGARMVKVFEGKHFKQTKAINLRGYQFVPIGGSDDSRRFAGTYDGDNKTISNMTVHTGSKGYAALFGAVDTVGTIKNVSLSSPVVSCDNYYYAGGVVAYSMGHTENCKVTNGKIRGYLIAGGVCGSSGPADKLSFTGTVEGASNIGGVIGNMRYPATNLSATNTTVIGYGGGETYSVGGVVGYMTSSSLNVKTGGYIEDCYFSGTVTMNRYSMFAGGIAGCSVEADIRRCFSVGEINTTSFVSQTAAGGIVGAIQGMKLEDCHFAGNMEVAGQWTSPLAGYAINIKMAGHPENSEIKNCFITGHSRSTSNYAYTPYLGWFDTRTAGVAPIITNCRVDASLHPRQSGAASGFTPLAEMISGTPWEGFSTDVWKFEKDFYPTIKTIPANSVANVAKAPLYFKNNDNVENCAVDFTVPTANSVKWQVMRNGKLGTEGRGIIISGANIHLNGSVATDTVYAVNGQIKKWFTIKTAPAGMFDGDGTAESPFLIKNKADLMRLSEATTVTQLTFDGSHFLITNDIDLGLDPEFKGISNCSSSTYKFGGVLDGGNHTIHGIRLVIPVLDEAGKIVDGKTSTRGFIGRLKQGGVVKNLRFASDCVFEFYSSSGAFVGENTGGEIINCRNYANVKAHAGTSGAIVGDNRAPGKVIDCYNAGDMIGGFHYVGGIASYNYGVVEGCQNDGRVATELINTQYSQSQLAGAGGIVLANFGQMYNCLNTGEVYSMKYAGGIEGWHNTTDKQTSMRGCINLGTVTCGEEATIGQITGHQYKVPVVEAVYWDAQTSSYPDAADGKALVGAQGVKTAFLISGDSISGFGKEWTFVKGQYPALKAFADEPKAKAAALAVVDFGASDHHKAIKHDAVLATSEGLVWSLVNKGKAFAVNGNALEMTACNENTDTLVATMGNFVRRIPLFSTPDTLVAPDIADTLTNDRTHYKLVFNHAVPGVTYFYTTDLSAPGPDNKKAQSTTGEAMVKVDSKDVTVRAVAYHRNYYLSPVVERVLVFMGVSGIDGAEVISTHYVNAAGMTSATPWQGVNVVITVYSNGTRTVEKRTFNK